MKRQMFPVDRLVPFYQARRKRSPQSRAALLNSIRQDGILTALLLAPHPDKPGFFWVVSGNTRLEIAKELGHTEVPGDQLPPGQTFAELLRYALTLDTHRENLSFLDLADGISDLAAAEGTTQAETAISLGLSAPAVCKINTCSTCLSDQAKHFITSQKVGLSIAYLVATRISHPDKQLATLQRYVAEKWNRDDLLKALKPAKPPKKITFSAEIQGIAITISCKVEAAHAELIEAFKSLASTIATHQKNGVPVRLLPELL